VLLRRKSSKQLNDVLRRWADLFLCVELAQRSNHSLQDGSTNQLFFRQKLHGRTLNLTAPCLINDTGLYRFPLGKLNIAGTRASWFPDWNQLSKTALKGSFCRSFLRAVYMDTPLEIARGEGEQLERELRRSPDFQLYLLTKSRRDRARMESVLMKIPQFALWRMMTKSEERARRQSLVSMRGGGAAARPGLRY
jgi:hypothetical protein